MKISRTIKIVTRAAFAALLVVPLLATPENIGGYSHGTIANVCGPTDGIELLLILTEKPLSCGQATPKRYIELALDGPFPKTIEFPTRNRHTEAARCEELNKAVNCDPAIGGGIAIDKSGSKGSYEFKFKNGDVEKGNFQVRRCVTRITCG